MPSACSIREWGEYERLYVWGVFSCRSERTRSDKAPQACRGHPPSRDVSRRGAAGSPYHILPYFERASLVL